MSFQTSAVIFCFLLISNATSFGQQKKPIPPVIITMGDSVKAMAEELIKKGFNGNAIAQIQFIE
jgi:hypothetical protein